MKYFHIFFLLIFISCTDTKVKPTLNSIIDYEDVPEQESWNSQIVFTEAGKKQAVLFAENIRIFSDKKIKTLRDLKIDFYDGIKLTSTLVADSGLIVDSSGFMYAINNVVAKNDSGAILFTDELIWNSKSGDITSDKFVRIIDKNEEIEGYGFKADQHFSTYSVFNITYISSNYENN